jgi:hypothetical protein
MYNFIVLGIVPGTNYQIEFDTWLKLAEMALLAYALLRLKAIHQAMPAKAWIRQPLPANQLHLRV